MKIEFDATDPQTVIAEAETRHDAYDLGALRAILVAAGRTVELIHEHETKPDYIALKLSLA